MPMKPAQHRVPASAKTHNAARLNDRLRGSAAARGYGSRWQRLAAMFRRSNPLCADPFGAHEGRAEPGAHVDHIVPRSRGGLDAWSNLQTLCHRCHSRKTILFDGGFGKTPRADR